MADVRSITPAVLQVGNGRGFVIAVGGLHYVVTAGHCLGTLPEAYAAREYFEATQEDFLGPLGGPRSVWAECVFIDPVADIAVLGHAGDSGALPACAGL